MKTMRGWTSGILRRWLFLEDVAQGMAGREDDCCWLCEHDEQQHLHREGEVGAAQEDAYHAHDEDNHRQEADLVCARDGNTSDTSDGDEDGVVLMPPAASPVGENHEQSGHQLSSPPSSSSRTSPNGHLFERIIPAATQQPSSRGRRRLDYAGGWRISYIVPRSFVGRCVFNGGALLVAAGLVACYAFLHVHIIQEDGVFYTAWFYEWFLIPVLISFVFAAPLHRALGFDNPATPTQELRQRLGRLEGDPTTQRLVAATALCYLAYIVGDAGFFIPISPFRDKVATYPTYLLAVLTNIGFIYQGFLLSILSMRAVAVRLNELEDEISLALQLQQAGPGTAVTHPTVTHQKILRWVHGYQELRHDMQSLSGHFGLRMVVGLTMFVVEVTNMILNVWEAVGSTLTKLQTLLLLLTYTANAAVLVMVAFQTAYTATTCSENIGPRLAVLSLRTPASTAGSSSSSSSSFGGSRNGGFSNSTDSSNHTMKAELNVLAQTFMQAPIRMRIGNFHVTAEYANALTAWFFGLFLVVFGMKLPKI